MGLTVTNRVVFLAAILASSFVALQAQSDSRLDPIKEEGSEYEYDDGVDTSCLNYCTSRLMGTTYCCQTATRPTGGHNVIDCSTNNVDCHGVRQPIHRYPHVIDCPTNNGGCHGIQKTVVTRPRVVIRDHRVTGFCGVSRCNPARDPAPIPDPVLDPQVIVIDEPLVERGPRYVCRHSDCNIVQTLWPRIRPARPVHRPPVRYPDVISPRSCDLEDLVTAVSRLLNRSYAKAYTMQNFIDGLQTIVDNHWDYSWFGQCIVPGPLESDEIYDEVDVFTHPATKTTEECHPCSARPGGFRRCSTRFQTILGSCDDCCHRSRSRVRSRSSRDLPVPSREVPVRTPVVDRPDIREEVNQLLEQARTLTRRDFLAALARILRNAEEQRYRWNQTVHTSDARAPETDAKEQVLPVTTLQPSAKMEVQENNSNWR